jgi:hypothetical protein
MALVQRCGPNDWRAKRCGPNDWRLKPCLIRPCCSLNGICALTTEADCLAVNGIWHNEVETCDELTGPCCLPDGSCELKTQAECLAAGGTWYGCRKTCNDLKGPCCVAGVCSEKTYAECIAAGGEWMGKCGNCGGITCPTQPCAACPGGYAPATAMAIVDITCGMECGFTIGSLRCKFISCEPLIEVPLTGTGCYYTWSGSIFVALAKCENPFVYPPCSDLSGTGTTTYLTGVSAGISKVGSEVKLSAFASLVLFGVSQLSCVPAVIPYCYGAYYVPNAASPDPHLPSVAGVTVIL